ESAGAVRPPFAPPFLKAGKLVIAQTANILLYLGARLNLAPREEAGRLWVHQLQLTIADLVVLIHDTHHPITGYLYYEEQRLAAPHSVQPAGHLPLLQGTRRLSEAGSAIVVAEAAASHAGEICLKPRRQMQQADHPHDRPRRDRRAV